MHQLNQLVLQLKNFDAMHIAHATEKQMWANTSSCSSKNAKI